MILAIHAATVAELLLATLVAVATHVVAVATLVEAILAAILAAILVPLVADAAESDVAESPAVVLAA